MKVLRRAEKQVHNVNCPICNSRLQADGSDVKWYVEGKIGRVTCPVCGCEHVPVAVYGYYRDTVFENDDKEF